MKHLKYILSVALCIFLVSCYEVNEEIQINADGSGTYVTKMDMGQLIDMMQTFAGELFIVRSGMDRVIDTTSMQKLFIPGILGALVKLLIELAFGAAAFLVVARLLKMEEMNTGLVRRVLNILHVPWL